MFQAEFLKFPSSKLLYFPSKLLYFPLLPYYIFTTVDINLLTLNWLKESAKYSTLFP